MYLFQPICLTIKMMGILNVYKKVHASYIVCSNISLDVNSKNLTFLALVILGVHLLVSLYQLGLNCLTIPIGSCRSFFPLEII
jgi:hypothetical protein